MVCSWIGSGGVSFREKHRKLRKLSFLVRIWMNEKNQNKPLSKNTLKTNVILSFFFFFFLTENDCFQ